MQEIMLKVMQKAMLKQEAILGQETMLKAVLDAVNVKGYSRLIEYLFSCICINIMLK